MDQYKLTIDIEDMQQYKDWRGMYPLHFSFDSRGVSVLSGGFYAQGCVVELVYGCSLACLVGPTLREPLF